MSRMGWTSPIAIGAHAPSPKVTTFLTTPGIAGPASSTPGHRGPHQRIRFHATAAISSAGRDGCSPSQYVKSPTSAPAT